MLRQWLERKSFSKPWYSVCSTLYCGQDLLLGTHRFQRILSETASDTVIHYGIDSELPSSCSPSKRLSASALRKQTKERDARQSCGERTGEEGLWSLILLKLPFPLSQIFSLALTLPLPMVPRLEMPPIPPPAVTWWFFLKLHPPPFLSSTLLAL